MKRKDAKAISQESGGCEIPALNTLLSCPGIIAEVRGMRLSGDFSKITEGSQSKRQDNKSQTKAVHPAKPPQQSVN